MCSRRCVLLLLIHALSLCVCLLDTAMISMKMDELVEMLFGLCTWVGLRNHVSDGASMTHGKGTLWGHKYLGMLRLARNQYSRAYSQGGSSNAAGLTVATCLCCYTGGSHVQPMHPSVGSSGLGTSCSPSPPKSVLSQSAPADVNAFTLLHSDFSAADSLGNVQVSGHGCLVCIQSVI